MHHTIYRPGINTGADRGGDGVCLLKTKAARCNYDADSYDTAHFSLLVPQAWYPGPGYPGPGTPWTGTPGIVTPGSGTLALHLWSHEALPFL